MTLSDVLVKEFEHPIVATLFRDLFGDKTPAALARHVEALLAPRHGAVKRGIFAAISVGGVFGVETTSGERLVLKVYPRRLGRAVLETVHAVQSRLHYLDFPVPRVRGTHSEAGMAGKAAAQFTAHWDIPTKITPSPAEARAFLAEYEAARGRKLSKLEWRVAAAAADLQIAVTARQEWGEGVRDEPYTFVELCRSLGERPLIGI